MAGWRVGGLRGGLVEIEVAVGLVGVGLERPRESLLAIDPCLAAYDLLSGIRIACIVICIRVLLHAWSETNCVAPLQTP